MTNKSQMPKLIENKNDLESLVPGEQVELETFTQSEIKGWIVYEGIINNKHAFMARDLQNGKAIIDNLVDYVPSFSKLSIRDLGTKGNSIILNLFISYQINAGDLFVAKLEGKLFFNKDKAEIIRYFPSNPFYSQKLKILKEAGL